MKLATRLSNRTFLLGVLVAGLLAATAVVGLFVFLQLIPDEGDRACDQIAKLDDTELVYDLGHFANNHNPGHAVTMGRKTRSEICDRAVDSLAETMQRD